MHDRQAKRNETGSPAAGPAASESLFDRTLKRFSHKSRTKKFDLFLALFRPRSGDRVLDIGASGRVFLRHTFEDVYPYLERVTAGGYEFEEVQSARSAYPQPRYAVFDGCALPFPDKSFDLAFSNAVIEHVLGEGRQELFAREVMRVARSWFITTPNFWFPFEPHYCLPFIQFLPRLVQREYNRLLGTHIPRGLVQEISLLSARQMARLFPTSNVARVRVTFWPETLVAYRIDPARAQPCGLPIPLEPLR
jgi:ubiquinone/menaquinone biosynthesis C-methylase UbiE